MSTPEGGHGVTVVICMKLDHRAPVDGITNFKRCLRDCPQVDGYMEVLGEHDLILKVRLGDIADFRAQLDRLSPLISKYVAHFETDFVSHVHEKSTAPGSEPFWVKCDDGHRRIDPRDIDLITAERDYVRFHIGGSTCLHHATIGETLERLDSTMFIRVHRSTIVRRDFIKRLIHRPNGWSARLADGTIQKISRGYAADVLRAVGLHGSSNPISLSSSVRPSVDIEDTIVEKQLTEY